MKKEKTEVSVIDLDQIDVNKLPELANFKERGQQLVKECVFVEIKDNASYELAKKNRTALRTFRTDVEKSDKAIKSKLNNFKNRVGEVSASLIAITEPSEKSQQAEVDRYEQIKENERLEKLRLEQERVDNIKNRIGEFRQYWEDKFSTLTFDGIESLKTNFKAVLNQHNRSIYQEFEVLFEDSVVYLNNLLEARIKTLTEQEEIRLEQVRLAEEREKQRIEAERIAEEQRKEREKLEAEQKAEAEKIRLAKEQFEREKREFEEKQAEAKFQERCKQLLEIGFILNERNEAYQKGLNYLNLEDIRNASDELWICELADAKNAKDFSEMTISADTQEVEFEEVKSEQSANEKPTETSSIGHSTRLKANTPMPEKELTWQSIFKKHNLYKEECNHNQKSWLPLESWLDKNYNVPTPKI